MDDYWPTSVQQRVQFPQESGFSRLVAYSKTAQRGFLVKDLFEATGGLGDMRTPFGGDHIGSNVVGSIVFEHNSNAGVLAGARGIDAIAVLVKIGHIRDVAGLRRPRTAPAGDARR